MGEGVTDQGGAVGVEALITHSRWTPGQPGVERGKARRYVRLLAKVGTTGVGEWRKVELTFARVNVPEFTRQGCRWVNADGSQRDAGAWFDLARKYRLVGEFIRRLGRRLGLPKEYFKASEFQQDGWLHYHVLIRVPGRRRMIGHKLLTQLWGWGLVWERPVDQGAIAYASKGVAYASKGIGAVPDYMHGKSRLTKLTSTSRGFYLDTVKRKPSEKSGKRRTVGTIGELVEKPRTGLRTKVKVIDGSTGVLVTRELKGGDAFTIAHTLKSFGFQIENFGGGIGWRCGFAKPAQAAAAAAGGEAATSLVESQYCGVSVPVGVLMHRLAMALDETERLLQG
jgi:hypothetical protein